MRRFGSCLAALEGERERESELRVVILSLLVGRRSIISVTLTTIFFLVAAPFWISAGWRRGRGSELPAAVCDLRTTCEGGR